MDFQYKLSNTKSKVCCHFCEKGRKYMQYIQLCLSCTKYLWKKRTQIGKEEVKLSICRWHEAICRKHYRNLLRNLQSIKTKKFSQIVEYKVNKIKNQLYFYILARCNLKIKLRKQTPLTVATRMKYQGINLTTEVQGLYNENYKTLAGEIKGLNKLWDIPCMWNGQKIWMDILPKKIWVANKHEKISTLSVTKETNWSHSEMPPYTHEDRCDQKDVQRWVLAAKWKSWNLHNLLLRTQNDTAALEDNWEFS